MRNKVDANKIMKKLRAKERSRTKISLYLDRALYERFKKACEEVPAYRVVEELMEDFIASSAHGKGQRK